MEALLIFTVGVCQETVGGESVDVLEPYLVVETLVDGGISAGGEVLSVAAASRCVAAVIEEADWRVR